MMSTVQPQALSYLRLWRHWPDPARLAVYLGGCLLLFLTCALPVWHEVPAYSDFGTYWASGNAANHGLSPYAAYPENYRPNYSTVGGPRDIPELNLNPPCLLPLFQVLAHLPLPKFSIALTICVFFGMIFTVALILWNHPAIQLRQLFWLLLYTTMRECVGEGSIYFIPFFLCAIAWIVMERRDGRSELLTAIAIGIVVAIKPTFAFWLAFLFLRGDRKLAYRSTAVALLVSIAPVFFYGVSVYRQWFLALADDSHWWSAGNIGIGPYFHRMGLPGVGMVLSWALAFALAAYVWKRRPDRKKTTMIAMCVGILCAPLGWTSYSLFLAPGFVSSRWGWPSNIAAFILALPQRVILTIALGHGRIAWAIGSGIWFSVFWIILFVSLARNPETGGTPELVDDPMSGKLRSV